MTRIAIVGPGAIGGTLAAWLSQNSELDISVAVRSPFESLVLQIPDGSVITAEPRILTNSQGAAPADWVLVTTKAYDVAGTATWLKQLVGPHTRVAIIQNGVEHIERFAPFVPVEQL